MDATDLPCPHCGYNLYGITSDHCPECGAAIDYSMLSQPRIPWEHWRQIGRVRAYWRTVVGFTFRPGLWARAGSPPSYGDAVRFRAVTIALAFLAIVAPVFALRIFVKGLDNPGDGYAAYYFFDPGRLNDYLAELLRQPASLAILLVGILLALIAVTGVAGFFFRSASLTVSRQNRAAALAHYTCAPLAWLPVTLWLLAASCGVKIWFVSLEVRSGGVTVLVVCCGLAVGVQIFLWWLGTLRVLRASTQADAGRVIACAIFTPLAGLLLFALIPVVLYLAISFFTLVAVSLLRH